MPGVPRRPGAARIIAERAPVRCGDCRQDLPPLPPSRDDARAEAEMYCPLCRVSLVPVVCCSRCGSEVCSVCGSILEAASDLGFG